MTTAVGCTASGRSASVDPASLRLVHHRQGDEVERISFFFETTEWEGQPVTKEPEKCLALQWFTVHELPEGIIEYPAAGLLGYLNDSGPSRSTAGGRS